MQSVLLNRLCSASWKAAQKCSAVAWGRLANTPFPVPAHRTGRADFRHPALRLTSLQSCRSRSIVDACHLQHADFSEHNAPREPTTATSAYFVPSGEEVSHPIVDVIVDRPVRRHTRPQREVIRPSPKYSVQVQDNLIQGAADATRHINSQIKCPRQKCAPNFSNIMPRRRAS